jgi:hypothetical protein
MNWLSDRARAIATDLSLELEECRWGQDPPHFDRDAFALALRAKGIRTVTTFDADDLADCAQGDAGKRGTAELRVRGVLRAIAAGKPRDANPFGQAVMHHGFTQEEARGAATMTVDGEAIRQPTYPCTMSMMLGYRSCQITADLDEDGKLVLVSLAFL